MDRIDVAGNGFSHLGFSPPRDRVWSGEHKRPPTENTPWPYTIKRLLREGWNHNLKDRLTMEHVVEALRDEILACQDDHNEDFADIGQSLDQAERRSTYVFDPNEMNALIDDELDESHNSDHFSMLSMSPFHAKKKPSIMQQNGEIQAACAEADKYDHVLFSPPKKSDGLVPPSSPYIRSCSPTVLPMLGLPDFDSDNDDGGNDNASIMDAKEKTCALEPHLDDIRKIDDEVLYRFDLVPESHKSHNDTGIDDCSCGGVSQVKDKHEVIASLSHDNESDVHGNSSSGSNTSETLSYSMVGEQEKYAEMEASDNFSVVTNQKMAAFESKPVILEEMLKIQESKDTSNLDEHIMDCKHMEIQPDCRSNFPNEIAQNFTTLDQVDMDVFANDCRVTRSDGQYNVHHLHGSKEGDDPYSGDCRMTRSGGQCSMQHLHENKEGDNPDLSNATSAKKKSCSNHNESTAKSKQNAPVTKPRIGALPYISPSYEFLKPQKEATIAASEDNDDLPPHLKERREKLSAKSESLMIRMKELKQRQNAIRSRVASLHNEDNDDD
jgi:hypothetical protein